MILSGIIPAPGHRFSARLSRTVSLLASPRSLPVCSFAMILTRDVLRISASIVSLLVSSIARMDSHVFSRNPSLRDEFFPRLSFPLVYSFI